MQNTEKFRCPTVRFISYLVVRQTDKKQINALMDTTAEKHYHRMAPFRKKLRSSTSDHLFVPVVRLYAI